MATARAALLLLAVTGTAGRPVAAASRTRRGTPLDDPEAIDRDPR